MIIMGIKLSLDVGTYCDEVPLTNKYLSPPVNKRMIDDTSWWSR